MKLEDAQIDDVFQVALFEFRDRTRIVKLLNFGYGIAQKLLLLMVRAASRRRLRI